MSIHGLNDLQPRLPDEGNYWVAPSATVVGDVTIGPEVGIWFGAVLRGDNEEIRVGCGSNVQDLTVCHTDMGHPLTIGADCTIGHRAILHGCTIEDGVLIGMGARIEGHGTSRIRIQGVEALGGVRHRIVPDRIETGTFLCAVVAAGGEAVLRDARADHLDAVIDKLREAGATISSGRDGQRGWIRVTAGGRPRGVGFRTSEYPGFPTDMQAQFMALMCVAEGTSVLEETIFENRFMHAPELTRMGARIEGEGTDTITVEGVDRLGGATHPVVTDRIELGTYMLAPAICGGEVTCLGGRIDLVESFCEKLDEAGIAVTESERGLTVSRKNGRVRAVNVRTEPFPGFPTDLQAQMMALLCTAEGVSDLEETIFENRFMHAPELTRMGARIDVHGGHARVTGVDRLKGAPVMATDLRASVSLILAGLAAEGETVVSRVYHLDRGYEKVVRKLRGVGADIERIKEAPAHE